MRVIVTGSAGFIGRNVVARLIAHGHDVEGVDRKKVGIWREVETISNIRDFDAVVHLAAQTSVWNADYRQIKKDNINAFMSIADKCELAGIPFIYASSSCSINITSLYGLSKQFADGYAALKKGPWVGLRFHNVYGRNPRPDTLMGCLLSNKRIPLFNNGENRRHFTYIDDVCDAVELALDGKHQGLYNVCNPQENSVIEFVKEIEKYVPVKYYLEPAERELDKERQAVDIKTPSILEHYTRINEGIKRCF